MKAYAIKDFRRRFLTPGYDKKGPLVFVAIPTKHDSCGYRRLVTEPNGAALYGAWVVLVAVAGKCPVKGILATDRPLTTADLATRTGLPEAVFVELLDRATRDDIGWVEQVNWTIPTYEGAGDSQESPGTPSDSKTLPENAGNRRKTPATDSTDLTDPTRQDLHNKTDTTKPDRGLHEDLTGADRNGAGWRNRFAINVATALGVRPEAAARQRRPLLAVARRLELHADRDERARRCIEVATEKRGAGLDNPCAAWQAEVNRLYPAGNGRS